MAELTIDAQIVYAKADRQLQINIRVPSGTTVSAAIATAGLTSMISTGSIKGAQVGIFSHRVTMDHVVEQGDRIEIYRPLTIDPINARRRRAL